MSEDGGDAVKPATLSEASRRRGKNTVEEVKVVGSVQENWVERKVRDHRCAESTHFGFSSGNMGREGARSDPVLRPLDEVLIESCGGWLSKIGFPLFLKPPSKASSPHGSTESVCVSW